MAQLSAFQVRCSESRCKYFRDAASLNPSAVIRSYPPAGVDVIRGSVISTVTSLETAFYLHTAFSVDTVWLKRESGAGGGGCVGVGVRARVRVCDMLYSLCLIRQRSLGTVL